MLNFIMLLATLKRDQGKCIIFTEGTMEQLTFQCSQQRYNVTRLIPSPLEAIKGQMNQKKLKYFLLSLYLHQTLKRTILSEIWVKIILLKPL